MREQSSGIRVLAGAVLLVLIVAALSLVSTRLWGGNMEQAAVMKEIVLSPDMTVADFGQQNGLKNDVLAKTMGVSLPQDSGKKIGELSLPEKLIIARVQKERALHQEFATKNWVKIPIKVGLWLVAIFVMFRLLRTGWITSTRRKWLYLSVVAVFGIILGNDPNPMNTLKDTVAIFGSRGILFPPRVVVMIVFLAVVVIANKLVCGWLCQFGTLQDLLFRLNRNRDGKPILMQFKLPFSVTNTVRASLFIAFVVLALGWGVDIIGPLDPFKLYNPMLVSALGAGFLALLLGASLFVYRPWCHFFCPFGFVGWILEKASVFKIKVNYETCIACEKCTRACPSSVMGAILKRDRTIPDCFSCGSCIEACPTKSVSFVKGKRELPPAEKFR